MRTHADVPWVPQLAVIGPKEERELIVTREQFEFFYPTAHDATFVVAEYTPDSGIQRDQVEMCDASGINILSDPLEIR